MSETAFDAMSRDSHPQGFEALLRIGHILLRTVENGDVAFLKDGRSVVLRKRRLAPEKTSDEEDVVRRLPDQCLRTPDAVFAALHDGPNEGQIAERIFINQGRQLLSRTGLNKVQLDKDFRQAISPRAGISLDTSGNILPHVSGVRGTVGPLLHLSSPAYHTLRNSVRNSRDHRAAPGPGK